MRQFSFNQNCLSYEWAWDITTTTSTTHKWTCNAPKSTFKVKENECQGHQPFFSLIFTIIVLGWVNICCSGGSTFSAPLTMPASVVDEFASSLLSCLVIDLVDKADWLVRPIIEHSLCCFLIACELILNGRVVNIILRQRRSAAEIWNERDTMLINFPIVTTIWLAHFNGLFFATCYLRLGGVAREFLDNCAMLTHGDFWHIVHIFIITWANENISYMYMPSKTTHSWWPHNEEARGACER